MSSPRNRWLLLFETTIPNGWLLGESVPVAATLLFWNLFGAVFQFAAPLQSLVATGGTLMAGLYVVVRGVALSWKVPVPETADLEALVRQNARVAAPAGVWFLGAAVLLAGREVGPGGDVLAALGSAAAGAGLGVVGLYAVAAGTAALRGEEAATERSAAEE